MNLFTQFLPDRRLPVPREFGVTLDESPPEGGPDQEAIPESGAGTEMDRDPRPDFPIVGVGASAGGLKSLAAFFSGMPPDHAPGMAFVLVQHLAPDHKSMLTELVKRQTWMDVFLVEDGMKVEPNCVYIIPPNRDLALRDGRLHLSEPDAPRGHRLPIDHFFRTLAREQGENAICVVLSGTGSDGTLGLRAIHGEGGMAMAQSPETAAYAGMPESAIQTGLVDFVLAPEEMHEQLIAYTRATVAGEARPHGPATPKAEPSVGSPDALGEIFSLIRDKTGHEFSGYKDTTVHRRIKRRMAIHQVARLEDYIRYLKTSPEEVQALFHEFLIGVTRFFRDPEAFEALGEAISGMVADKAPGSTVRAWVPGCSTGEEAYSIAILFRQRMDSVKKNLKVQVFATDIDARSIRLARAGLYPASVAPDLPDDALTQFFVPEGNGEAAYRIQKDIRETLVFSEQNVLRDPPFSRLDLISCRNLLIYLGPELQDQLIPLFHYALKPGGLLFLGTSEGVGGFSDLFAPLDRRMSLYRRLAVPHPHRRMDPGSFMRPSTKPSSALGPTEAMPTSGPVPLRTVTEAALLEETAAVAALVDDAGEILYLHGRTGLYLEPAPGDGGMNVLRMAREGLRRELAIALRRAVTRQERVSRDGLKVKTNGDSVLADLVVRPVTASPPANPEERESARPPLYLVILKAVPFPAPDGVTRQAHGKDELDDPEQMERIRLLESELEAKEEYLRTTQEEMQTSIEELQSTNEEIQSANEELETSQEELQSLNEELATVNTELESKVADLSRAHNDMNNLLAGTGIATLFVNHQLRIQRFTPTATRLMNLIDADVGRPVGDLASKLVGYDSLAADTDKVLETLEAREIEVETGEGRWYLLGIRPYRTLENVIEGAVITFTEITELKKAQAAVREAEDLRRLAVVVRDSNDPIVSQDLEGRIQTWNPAAARVFGWNEEDALEMNYLDLVPEGLRAETESMFEAIHRGKEVTPLQTERQTRDGESITIWLTATRLVDDSGRPYGISTTERPLRPEAQESE